jgi:hypothetical protein
MTYLEIGTREGDSLKKILQYSNNISDIFVCDTWGSVYGGSGKSTHDHIVHMIKEVGYNKTITFLDGDSKIEIPKLYDSKKSYFDLILVNGDHSADGGRIDLENVLLLAKKNSCILFHDIVHPEHLYLEQVFDEFVEKYKNMWRKKPEKIKDDVGIGILYL